MGCRADYVHAVAEIGDTHVGVGARAQERAVDMPYTPFNGAVAAYYDSAVTDFTVTDASESISGPSTDATNEPL